MKKHTVFFYILLLVVTIATFLLVKPYLITILLAFFSAILFHPIYEIFMKWTKDRSGLSALLTLGAVFLLMLVPLTLLIAMTLVQVAEFKDNVIEFVNSPILNFDDIIASLNNILDKIPGFSGDITVEEATAFMQQSLKSLSAWFVGSALIIGGSSVEYITKLIVYVSLLLTFLRSKDRVTSYLMNVSPMDNKIDKLYIRRITEMSKSMILGTFVIAAVQAVMSGVVMFIFGVPYTAFWTVLMTFTGIIPLIGTQIVSIPIGIVQIASGNVWEGILLILFAVFVVGFVDNFLRPMLVTKDAELHPMLTLIGVLGGMQLFGVLGFIFGPVLMIIFYTTVETYMHHYKKQVQPK